MNHITKREVVMVPPDPNWNHLFQLEKKILERIFGDLLIQIYHIGSTAITGCYSKPIIDLLPEVRHIELVDAYNDKMKKEGYIPKGEFGIPKRRFFIKGDEINRTHHVHIFETGDPEIARHVLFRDYMNHLPQEVNKYNQLKKKLALEYRFDIIGYMNGKDGFIKNIDRKAKKWRDTVGHVN